LFTLVRLSSSPASASSFLPLSSPALSMLLLTISVPLSAVLGPVDAGSTLLLSCQRPAFSSVILARIGDASSHHIFPFVSADSGLVRVNPNPHRYPLVCRLKTAGSGLTRDRAFRFRTYWRWFDSPLLQPTPHLFSRFLRPPWWSYFTPKCASCLQFQDLFTLVRLSSSVNASPFLPLSSPALVNCFSP